MKRRRRFYLFILVTTLVVALGGGLYNKSHHIENCEVLNVIKNTVFVRHSNGLTYSVTVEDPETYQNINTVRIVFDQLTDWEKYYTIKDISPIK